MILTAATILVLGTAAASAAEVVVIVNEANPIGSLTAKQVKGHFLKNPATWGDGSRVRPVDRAASDPNRAAFLSEVLDMSSAELERYWISRQYSTAEEPPPKAKDEAETIQLVDSLAGGIGFVSRKALEGAGNARIKAVLTITY
ncbi:MAG: hypothetical protein ACRD1Z_06820 [Vicinamibacteria bacterium]